MSRMDRHSAVSVLSALVFAQLISGCVFAQSPQSLSSSHASQKDTQPITLDVVVTDEYGERVKGLQQSDFEFREGRKEEQIAKFEEHRDISTAGKDPGPALPENTYTNLAVSSTASVNVILLDQLNTSEEEQQRALVALKQFFEHKPAGSQFAIFSLRLGDPACPNCNNLQIVQGLTENKEELIAALGTHEIEPQKRLLKWNFGIEDTSLSSLADVGAYLMALPGRKNLIWMSGQLDTAPLAFVSDILFAPKFKGWEAYDPFSSVLTLHLAADRLAAARVAFYLIDLSGRLKKFTESRECIVTHHPVSSTDSASAHLDMCASEGEKIDKSARLLGGRGFHGINNIPQAIMAAYEDQADYYTIVYDPPKAKSPGQVRHLKVSVRQKKYSLLYREYFYTDGPVSLRPAENSQMADFVLHRASGIIPYTIARLAPVEKPAEDGSPDPLLAAMQMGTPAWRDIGFTVHLTGAGRAVNATPEQKETLSGYSGFTQERLDLALEESLREKSKEFNRKRFILESLPMPEHIWLQPYQIEYDIPASQLTMRTAEDGKHRLDLEMAMLAFDRNGKRLTGIKDTVQVILEPSEKAEFQTSGFHRTQEIAIPWTAAVIRLAIRDAVSKKMGSLEIPVWSITNPYKRQRLELPK